ncbi:hypothetical protein [Paenibacillus arenosi]|uniref:Uncharacterized protein n=1 Tax=Paenibacillus arenosi TaxID=2774142 RepID=A0ABR9AYV7_9BACL|nr:hypothetical protein [Paenibacillus arenosi]MBD8499263.1 hypothetical protein [Paenibacillus arenosi]
MQSSSSQSLTTSLLLLMIAIGVIVSSDTGVKHSLFIASERQTGTGTV